MTRKIEGGGRVDEIDVVCSVSEMRGFIETCQCHRQKIEHMMEKPRLCYLKLFRAFAIVYLWGMFDSLAITAFLIISFFTMLVCLYYLSSIVSDCIGGWQGVVFL